MTPPRGSTAVGELVMSLPRGRIDAQAEAAGRKAVNDDDDDDDEAREWKALRPVSLIDDESVDRRMSASDRKEQIKGNMDRP